MDVFGVAVEECAVAADEVSVAGDSSLAVVFRDIALGRQVFGEKDVEDCVVVLEFILVADDRPPRAVGVVG